MVVDRPLRIATFLAPNVYPVYAYIAQYLGRKLGCPTEILVGDSHDKFDSLHPDIAFICGLPYVLMMRQGPPPVELLAAPVLQGERFAGKPIYYSDVIVHRDASFQSFADLRGHSWAYNEEVSQSGYGITRHHLLTLSATSGFFSQVVNAGWHQKAIEMVANKQIDAAAIDCQVLMIELRDHPELSGQIKIIDALGPSTIQPVVARTDLPASLKSDARGVLLELADDPDARHQLAQGYFDHFVPATDHDYDDIRAMLHAAQTANFMIIH